MKKRVFKHFILKVMKWMFYISFIYIVYTLLTRTSQQQESEKLSTNESQTNFNENMSTGKSQAKVRENLSIERTSDIVASHESRNSPMARTDPPRDIKSVSADPSNDKSSEKVALHKSHNSPVTATDPPRESASKICHGITFPLQLPSEDTWQPVDKSKSVYVLSAYYVKEKSSVFVMGVRPDNVVYVICQLWKGGAGATGQLIEESKAIEPPNIYYGGYEYTSTVFHCPVSSSTQPTHVSLVEKKCDSPTNVLQIRSATPELPYQRRFTVCLSPLIMNFDATLRFVKWVEINKLLGVKKFIVYNFSSSDNIARLLEFYTNQGLIEVVQWKPPFVVNGLGHNHIPVQIETYGSKVALNDCLFRNKQYSEYISNIDINEFIIPRAMDTSLIDMVNKLKGNVAAYYINMAFTKKIRTQSVNRTKSPKEKPALESPETKTTVHIGFMGNRISKLIIRTSDVDFTLPRHAPGVETFIVPPQQSVLHIHPGFGQNQALGTLVDKILPQKIIGKVQYEVRNVKNSLPNVPIR